MAMQSEDTVMMDVDAPSPASPTTTTTTKSKPKPTQHWPKPKFVAAPSSPADLECIFTAQNSNEKDIIKFITRWPPSRTPFEYGPWLHANRGGLITAPLPNQPPQPPQDLEGLAASFQSLKEAGNVTPDALDLISKAHNVLVGKWMVFEEPPKIDMLWGKILYYMCVEREKGYAKVSTWKEGEKHVICVYVEDYTDKEEVGRVRKALRGVGVTWKIGFKTDAYTHLGIYKDNEWNLRPSRYLE